MILVGLAVNIKKIPQVPKILAIFDPLFKKSFCDVDMEIFGLPL